MAGPYFPFHALGFKSNPFRALADDEWAEVAVLPDAVLSILASGFAHLQVLGEMGHGKTTILLGLAARFRREGKRVTYEYLPEGQCEFHTGLDGLDVFLLDEAQRLTVNERGRLTSTAQLAGGGLHLVLGSHDDVTPLFASRGLLLATVHLDDADSISHLSAVLARRLDYFALAQESPGATLTLDAVHYLHETFGGNLRAAQYFLYEVFQRLKHQGAITAEHLRVEAAISGEGPK